MTATCSNREGRKPNNSRCWEHILPEESTVLTFGGLAVERGFITEAERDRALREQERRRRKGTTLRFGRILRELGHVTERDITKLFELQGRLGGHTEIEGYEVVEQIGRGAMGRIYKARQLRMDRIVALKILAPKIAADKDYINRFLREAKLASKLQHENIVFVLDAGISNGVHYYVMEYIKGRTLKEILVVRKAFSEKEVLRLGVHIAQALEHAHAKGVLHRDIKPSNIIVSEGRVPKLCDFGLAKDLIFNPDPTATGTIRGTPYYISPEQIRGKANDIRSDIYSLGATLYHCACGEVPFTAPGSLSLMVKHLTENPEPLRKRRAEISEVTAGVIHKMLEKDPDDRFQSSTELRRALEALVFENMKPIEVEVEELPDKPVRKKGRVPRRRRKKK